MILGGVAELVFGVRAEQQSLENVARPLTAEEAETDPQEHDVLLRHDRELGQSAEDIQRSIRREERIRDRTAAHRQREARGGRRYRPGPGHTLYSPGMVGTAGTTSRSQAHSEERLDEELIALRRVLYKHGPLDRGPLGDRVGARLWGPGRFRSALQRMVEEGGAERLSGARYRLRGKSPSHRQ
jgi:hypothetical protein